MKEPRPTQKELIKENYYIPLTIKDIQNRLSISSTGVVHHYIQQLQKKWYLNKNSFNNYQVDTNNYDSNFVILDLYENAKFRPIVCSYFDKIFIKKIKMENNKIFLYSFNQKYDKIEINKKYFNLKGIVRVIIPYNTG